MQATDTPPAPGEPFVTRARDGAPKGTVMMVIRRAGAGGWWVRGDDGRVYAITRTLSGRGWIEAGCLE